MNNEVLNKLRDVHLPKAPSWWPPAVGYYLVALLFILLFVGLYLWNRRREPARLVRKQLLEELAVLEHNFKSTGDVAFLQGQIAAMVRRLLAYRSKVATLVTTEFSGIRPQLNLIFPDQQNTSLLIELLNKDRYQREPEVDGRRLIHCARELIKRCRI